MANGMDSKELLVRENVERGLKRDFAFDTKSELRRRCEDESEGLGDKRLKSLNVGAEEVLEKVVSDVEDGKSDVVDWLSEDELTNRLIESEQGEEMNDKKSNAVVVMEFDNNCEDDQISNLVESPTTEDLKDDETTVCMNGGEFVSNEDSSRDGVESLCEVGDTKEWIISLEKTRKRVTRSSLKSKAIPVRTEAPMEHVAVEEHGSGCYSHATISERKVATVLTQSTMTKLLTDFPKKLKDFLDTGILDDAPVKYMRGSKSKGITETGLPGIIKGSGILCFCEECKGAKVVSPNLFEIHAGSANKRPPDYIQLDNGRTLRDVMNACKNASPNTLERSFQDVVCGSSVKTCSTSLQCRSSTVEASPAKSEWISNSCVESQGQVTEASVNRITQTVNSNERSSSSVSVPKSFVKVSSRGPSSSKSKGKLTKKNLGLHKAVFNTDDILKDGTEVRYIIQSQIMLVGKRKGFGIHCNCCDLVISPSLFEAHAGYASRRKPFQNIFDSDGKSLHELAVNQSKDGRLSTRDNDDCCTICSSGGDLMSCDGCPRAFHIGCVRLECRPTENWFCKTCLNNFSEKPRAGRHEGAVSSMRKTQSNCSRIGGCILCSSPKFSISGFGPLTVIICEQCEKEHHVGCLRKEWNLDLQELPEGPWFCCTQCQKIYSTLGYLDAEGEKELSGSQLDIITRKQYEVSRMNMLDIKWRLIRGKHSSEKCNLLLTEVDGIFHDRFGLIPDTASSTSRPDLIPAMVRGEKLSDRYFGGMHCAVLTVNSVVVSALIVRIFGKELAEIPLVATDEMHAGKGYFRALFSCIEHLLGSLGVEMIVLPAADEAESIWLDNFGFTRMTKDELKNYMKNHDLMIFQGTSWLQKAVPPCPSL